MKPQILKRCLRPEEVQSYLSLLSAAEEGMKYILDCRVLLLQGSIPSNLVKLAKEHGVSGIYCFHYVNANAEISAKDGSINYAPSEPRVKMGFVYLPIQAKPTPEELARIKALKEEAI